MRPPLLRRIAPYPARRTSSKRYWLLPIGLWLGAAATGLSREAHAQEASAVDIAQARELLNQGLDSRKRGDNAGSLEKLKGAHALGRTPITGLELGRAYAAMGQLVEARETFLSVERIPVRPEETARSKAARAQCAGIAAPAITRAPRRTS